MKEFKPSLEIPNEVWQYVMDRDAWVCQNEQCINKFSQYANLTVHHIIARSGGGLGTDPCNLIVLCWACHEKVEEWKIIHEDLCVTDPAKLMHREPAAFYDHDFPENYIKCSHAKTI